jgi:hypothetical protein
MLDAVYPAERDVPPPGGDVGEAGRAVPPVKGWREGGCVEGGKGTWKASTAGWGLSVCLPVCLEQGHAETHPKPIRPLLTAHSFGSIYRSGATWNKKNNKKKRQKLMRLSENRTRS